MRCLHCLDVLCFWCLGMRWFWCPCMRVIGRAEPVCFGILPEWSKGADLRSARRLSAWVQTPQVPSYAVARELVGLHTRDHTPALTSHKTQRASAFDTYTFRPTHMHTCDVRHAGSVHLMSDVFICYCGYCGYCGYCDYCGYCGYCDYCDLHVGR